MGKKKKTKERNTGFKIYPGRDCFFLPPLLQLLWSIISGLLISFFFPSNNLLIGPSAFIIYLHHSWNHLAKPNQAPSFFCPKPSMVSLSLVCEQTPSPPAFAHSLTSSFTTTLPCSLSSSTSGLLTVLRVDHAASGLLSSSDIPLCPGFSSYR